MVYRAIRFMGLAARDIARLLASLFMALAAWDCLFVPDWSQRYLFAGLFALAAWQLLKAVLNNEPLLRSATRSPTDTRR